MEQLPKIKTILSCAGIPIFGCCPFEPLRPQILECRAKERLPADAKSIFVALFPYAIGGSGPIRAGTYPAMPRWGIITKSCRNTSNELYRL